MRSICPRCGVTGKKDAEFCVSCGQALKTSVSSIPPTRFASRAPASEVNVNSVVLDSKPAPHSKGVKSEVSVRYRTIPTDAKLKEPPIDRGADVKPAISNFRETVVLHAPAVPEVEPAPVKTATSRQPARQPAPETAKVRPAPAKTTSEAPDLGFSIEPLRTKAPLVPLEKAEEPKRKVLKTEELPPLEIQHIWYKITSRPAWNTIAVMPASENLCVLEIAHGLGAMAVREPCEFVRVVNSSMLASRNCKRNGDASTEKTPRTYPYDYFDLVQQLQPEATSQAVTQLTRELLAQFDKARENGALSDGKVFVAIDPIESHPDAIALSRAVDKLIICIKLGETSFDSIRQTISTVGKDRILGCIAIK